jgi:hypothetical protein
MDAKVGISKAKLQKTKCKSGWSKDGQDAAFAAEDIAYLIP